MENINDSNINTLTDEQIDDIVIAAEESNDGKMEEIKESTEINTDANLESETVTSAFHGPVIVGNGLGNSTEKALKDFLEEGKSPQLSLVGSNNPIITNSNNEDGNPAMDEKDMLAFASLISKYKKDKTYPVYKNMPESMKEAVRQVAIANNIPASGWNRVATMILEEFVNDSKIDDAFIDLEKVIDDALDMPSVVDMYSEHTKNIMETYIPEMAEKIKDEFPDKAARLLEVRDAFVRSYTFSFAKESYDTNARVRKAMRRWESEYSKCLESFNFLNSRSNFKMNDVTEIVQVLSDILITEPNQIREMHSKSGEIIPERYQMLLDLNASMEDVIKFCILICKSCMNLDPENVVDAAYMYYMVKNIIVLKHTQEAKTDFAIELINNICNTIIFIRNKEDEFNESMVKSKSGKKRKSDK